MVGRTWALRTSRKLRDPRPCETRRCASSQARRSSKTSSPPAERGRRTAEGHNPHGYDHGVAEVGPLRLVGPLGSGLWPARQEELKAMFVTWTTLRMRRCTLHVLIAAMCTAAVGVMGGVDATASKASASSTLQV